MSLKLERFATLTGEQALYHMGSVDRIPNEIGGSESINLKYRAEKRNLVLLSIVTIGVAVILGKVAVLLVLIVPVIAYGRYRQKHSDALGLLEKPFIPLARTLLSAKAHVEKMRRDQEQREVDDRDRPDDGFMEPATARHRANRGVVDRCIEHLKPFQLAKHEKSFDAAVHGLVEACSDYLEPARNVKNGDCDGIYYRVEFDEEGINEKGYFSHVDGREIVKAKQ
ncbi:MAG: hypothetical protein H0X51_08740 [Parachlamydiaceae bacterium]|nr:hypothetical protein [Parachlamydiaceae bacterium]